MPLKVSACSYFNFATQTSNKGLGLDLFSQIITLTVSASAESKLVNTTFVSPVGNIFCLFFQRKHFPLTKMKD